MKEKKTPDSSAHNQSSCTLSAQCVEWLDAIDLLAERSGATPPFSSDHTDQTNRETRRARELADHARQCSICTRALADARRVRDVQRRAIRALLVESEQAVPSTTTSILAALRNEPRPLPLADAPVTPEPEFIDVSPPLPLHSHPPQVRKSARGQSLLTWLVAAVVILASIAAFSQLAIFRTPAHIGPTAASTTKNNTISTPPVSTARTLEHSDAWSSVVLTQLSPDQKQLWIEQVDPLTGQRVLLVPGCCPANTQVDGVTHDGYDLLYHVNTSTTSVYHLLSGKVFTVKDNTGSAVWSTDNTQFFVNSKRSIVQITVATGEQKVFNSSIPADISRIEFFYNNAVYFSHSENAVKDLYRFDLATQKVDKLVERASNVYPFWIDLRLNAEGETGTAFFFVRFEADALPATYRDKQDGTGAHPWHFNAVPVGYGPDLLPIFVQNQADQFNVVKMGDVLADGERIMDEPVRDNIVPDATALCHSTAVPPSADPAGRICQDSLALIPEAASRLVVGANYKDGVYRLWSVDLAQGSQLQPLKLFELPDQSGSQIKLVGWNKLHATS